MEQIYNGRKYKIYSKVKIPKIYGEFDEKSYLYFIKVNGQVYHKVGETCNIIQRMRQHCKSYNVTEITILWISPALSAYTAKRIETRVIKEWQQRKGWEYKRNDRFVIPNDVTEITIPIRKNYNFSIR